MTIPNIRSLDPSTYGEIHLCGSTQYPASHCFFFQIFCGQFWSSVSSRLTDHLIHGMAALFACCSSHTIYDAFRRSSCHGHDMFFKSWDPPVIPWVCRCERDPKERASGGLCGSHLLTDFLQDSTWCCSSSLLPLRRIKHTNSSQSNPRANRLSSLSDSPKVSKGSKGERIDGVIYQFCWIYTLEIQRLDTTLGNIREANVRTLVNMILAKWKKIHQPRFPWNSRGFPFQNATFWGRRSCFWSL